jgi:hypothetical protein
MLFLNRRGFVKWAGAATGAVLARVNRFTAQVPRTNVGVEAEAVHSGGSVAEPMLDPQEIYRLLGFATMSGEDPLKLWQRLEETHQWRAGPLSPDGWSGSAFVADDADIFAFRTLSVPDAWMKDYQKGSQAEYCAKNFDRWW